MSTLTGGDYSPPFFLFFVFIIKSGMSLKRPFAYNTGSTINGTEQYGNLAVGFDSQTYAKDIGGVKWWMGPDEGRGYVIAKPVHDGTQPNSLNVEAKVAFSRSSELTEDSFITLLNGLNLTGYTFTDGIEGKNWLESNGYWTSFEDGGNRIEPTPTPTMTVSNTPTPSVTSTASNIPTPSITITPSTTPYESSPTPTPSETSCFEYLTDENGNYITDENGNYIVIKDLCVSPTPTNTPTPTPTISISNTPTPTPTNTQTPTPSLTPSITPSVTSSPIPVTGYPFNLVVLPYRVPYSGTTIISNNIGGTQEGSTDPNILEGVPNPEGIYWNSIDANGVDRTDYFSGFTGQSVTITITQNGSTAIYSGPVGAGPASSPTGGSPLPGLVFDTWTDQDPDPSINSGTGFYFRDAGTAYTENNVTLIQEAPTPWVVGDPVYISVVINPTPTPTPTPSTNIDSVNTIFIHVPN